MATLLVLLSYLCLWSALGDHRRLPWCGYVASTALALYGEYATAVALLPQVLFWSEARETGQVRSLLRSWGVVACLLMPFGLEKLALVPMGWGIDVTIAVAQWVAALPGNVWSMPRLPTVGVVLVALGGCWLCLWQGRWRWWGTAGIAAGLATMLLTSPPDLILADWLAHDPADALGEHRLREVLPSAEHTYAPSDVQLELITRASHAATVCPNPAYLP